MFDDLKKKINEVSKSKKIKVFYFGNTASTEKNSFYLTTTRENKNFIYFGAIVFSEKIAKKIAKIIDGKFNFILTDLEKKVISLNKIRYVNIDRVVKENIKKTKIYNYKGNDLTVNACETLVNHIYSNDPKGIGGKKILILGAGNIGFKLSLKFTESGANLYIFRRNKTILKNLSNTINFIKPKATIAKSRTVNSLNINLNKFDLIIGTTDRKSLINLEHVKKLSKQIKIIDIGKGILEKEALRLLINKSIELYRLDVTPAYDGYLENIYRTTEINDSNLKKTRIFKKFNLVKRGILSDDGTLIVDDVDNPKVLYGISDGRGGFKKISVKKLNNLKNTLKKND